MPLVLVHEGFYEQRLLILYAFVNQPVYTIFLNFNYSFLFVSRFLFTYLYEYFMTCILYFIYTHILTNHAKSWYWRKLHYIIIYNKIFLWCNLKAEYLNHIIPYRKHSDLLNKILQRISVEFPWQTVCSHNNFPGSLILHQSTNRITLKFKSKSASEFSYQTASYYYYRQNTVPSTIFFIPCVYMHHILLTYISMNWLRFSYFCFLFTRAFWLYEHRKRANRSAKFNLLCMQYVCSEYKLFVAAEIESGFNHTDEHPIRKLPDTNLIKRKEKRTITQLQFKTLSQFTNSESL